MSKEHLNRIAEVRKKAGLTQAQLAEKLGVHWVTVSKLERGRIQFHTGWMESIAEVLGVEPIDLLASRPTTREITIVGSLPGGGQFDDFRDENNDYDEFEIDIYERPLGDEFGNWIIVEGDGSWPVYHDQDMLYFIPIEENELSEYLGRLTILWKDNLNACAGFLTAWSVDRGADIQPINGKPIQGLPVYAAWVLAEVRYSFQAQPLTIPKDKPFG